MPCIQIANLFLVIVGLITWTRDAGGVTFHSVSTTAPCSQGSLNVSGRSVTSVASDDFLGLLGSTCVFDGSVITRINLANNALASLPINLFSTNTGSYPSGIVFDFSNNLFTPSGVANFFASPNGFQSVFGIFNVYSASAPFGIILSHNSIGPSVPAVFGQVIAGNITLRYCGFTALNSFNFNGMGTLPFGYMSGSANPGVGLDISYNQLGALPDYIFVGAILTYITLTNTGITSFTSRTFAFMSFAIGYTSALDLSGNSISVFPSSAFVKTSLTSLVVNSRAITQIATFAFAGLSLTQSLNLSGTSVTTLFANTFSGSSMKSALLDSNSGITSMESYTFAGMTTSLPIDLSSMKISVIPPNAFASSSFGGLKIVSSALVTIMPFAFNGMTLTGTCVLDVSNNDLSNGISAYSFSNIAVFNLASNASLSIAMNNCNLRSSSLHNAMFHSNTTSASIGISMSNALASVPNNAQAYISTRPNVFFDFPDGIFDAPAPLSSYKLAPWSHIVLGDFISYSGSNGIFGNASFLPNTAGDALTPGITITIASTIAVAIFANTVSSAANFCPLQQLARAMTHRVVVAGATYGYLPLIIIGASLPLPHLLPVTDACTIPDCSSYGTRVAGKNACRSNFNAITLPTEPGTLVRSLYTWLNLVGFRYPQASMLAFTFPVNGAWNTALNVSNWMPVDMLNDIKVSSLIMPGLPYLDGTYQMPFPPPSGVFEGIDTSALVLVDWSSAHSFSSGMFYGISVSTPHIVVRIATDYLYCGNQAVPFDFFSPFDRLNSVSVVSVGSASSIFACPYAYSNVASSVPFIQNQVYGTCPDAGWYTKFIGLYYYCGSCPLGSYCNSTLGNAALACAAGSYADTLRQTHCTACAEGTFNPAVGSSSYAACLQCPPSTSNSMLGGTSIASCLDCAPGTASSSPGMLACAACVPGYYQPASRQAQCIPCVSNTYQSAYGSHNVSDCVQCPASSPFAPVGSSSGLACSSGVSCADGLYTRLSDASSCMSFCPIGSFCAGGIETQCPAGSYASNIGQAACTPCGTGLFGFNRGSSNASDCTQCPLSTFGASAIASACTPCRSGTMSSVLGSYSNASCVFINGCIVPDSGTAAVLIVKSSLLCPLGASEAIDASVLMPDGLAIMNTLRMSLAADLNTEGFTAHQLDALYAISPPSSNSTSLREVAFHNDAILAMGGGDSTTASTTPVQVTILSNGTVAFIVSIVILLVCVVVPWFMYRYISADHAIRFDQFYASHETDMDKSPVFEATQLGAAATMSFVGAALLVIVFLSLSTNTVITSALVPPSSLGIREIARADIEITIRAYSSISSVQAYCVPSVSTYGTSDSDLSGAFSTQRYAEGQFCAVSATCVGCSVVGASSRSSFTFPYDTQLIEYEVWISSATPGSWSRRYGVVQQLPGSLLNQASDLEFTVIESYYTDSTSSRSLVAHTGYEMDFLQYTSTTLQNVSTYNSGRSVTLGIVLTKSSVVFQTLLDNKLSALQVISGILTSIVSLFSVYSIMFSKVESIAVQKWLKSTPGKIKQLANGVHFVVQQDSVLQIKSHLNTDVEIMEIESCTVEVNEPGAADINNYEKQNVDSASILHPA